MFRFTLAKLAALGAATASIAGAGALGATQLTSAAPAAAHLTAATVSPSPSPSGAAARHRGKDVLGRALHHRLVKATAAATGQTIAQVRDELRSGKSLAQIAASKTAAIEKTVGDAVKTRLDKAVAKGRITPDQERDILAKLQEAIAKEMAATHTKSAAVAATPSV
jgi:ABC-type antimicrobial peptide transport system permease subunit